MSLAVHTGRPVDAAGRLPQELAVYDLLDGLGIKYDRVDHEPVRTMDACAEIDVALAPAAVCKNLFLRDSKRTGLYLLMLCGDKKLRAKEIARQVGCSRLEFAPPELMERHLGIEPGAVTVMGIMNDTDNQVNLLVDKDLLAAEYIGCHPCVNTSSLRLRSSDLFGPVLATLHHGYTPVTVEPA